MHQPNVLKDHIASVYFTFFNFIFFFFILLKFEVYYKYILDTAVLSPFNIQLGSDIILIFFVFVSLKYGFHSV